MTPDQQRQENTPGENRLIESGQPGEQQPEPAKAPETLGETTVGAEQDEAQVDVATE